MSIKVVIHKQMLNSKHALISIIDNNETILNRRKMKIVLTEDGDEIDFEKLKKSISHQVQYHRSDNKSIKVDSGRNISNSVFE